MAKQLYTLARELKSKQGTWRRSVLTLNELQEELDKYIETETQNQPDWFSPRFYVEPHQPHHVDGEDTTQGPFR